MKSNHTKRLLIVLVVLLAFPILVNAQRTKPRLRRAAPRSTTTVAPVLVPVGTNLKIRLNDTLSSKESRAGDTGSIAMQGGKELKLESGTEMLVHVTR